MATLVRMVVINNYRWASFFSALHQLPNFILQCNASPSSRPSRKRPQLRVSIMHTRSRSAAAGATLSTDLSTPSSILPTTRTTRASKRAHTSTAADKSSSDEPAKKRPKPSTLTVSITAVNRDTLVDFTTLDTYLGRLIPIVNGGQVKGGVVAALTQLLPHHSPTPAGDSHTHHTQPLKLPSFNRLCGWLHLHNLLCLFINLPHPATTTSASSSASPAPYNNVFMRHSRTRRTCFTWYTPATLQPTNPLVHTLVAASRQSEVRVLLFCRRSVVSGGSGVEGYRYYGSVGYMKHNVDVRPIPFVLELLDAERVEALMRQEQGTQQQQQQGEQHTSHTADTDDT